LLPFVTLASPWRLEYRLDLTERRQVGTPMGVRSSSSSPVPDQAARVQTIGTPARRPPLRPRVGFSDPVSLPKLGES